MEAIRACVSSQATFHSRPRPERNRRNRRATAPGGTDVPPRPDRGINFDTACALTTSPVSMATTRPTCRALMQRKNASRISRATSSVRRQKRRKPRGRKLLPAFEQCASESCRMGSRNPARSTRCDTAAAGFAAAGRPRARRGDPAAPASTASRQTWFARTDSQGSVLACEAKTNLHPLSLHNRKLHHLPANVSAEKRR
jgi:hypothetical protein